MITIWGRNTSSNVQVAMWAIAELGLEHERIDWGGKFGGNDDPEYRAMNPNGLVPTVRDGDLVLWESPAILRYLGARYGGEGFWPADPAERARLDMWAEWAKTSICPPLIYQVFWQLVRTPEDQRSTCVSPISCWATPCTVTTRWISSGRRRRTSTPITPGCRSARPIASMSWCPTRGCG
jgi:glutathione S-transferase